MSQSTPTVYNINSPIKGQITILYSNRIYRIIRQGRQAVNKILVTETKSAGVMKWKSEEEHLKREKGESAVCSKTQ